MEHEVDRAAAAAASASHGSAGGGLGYPGDAPTGAVQPLDAGVAMTLAGAPPGSGGGGGGDGVGAVASASIESVKGGEGLMDAMDLVQAEVAAAAARTANATYVQPFYPSLPPPFLPLLPFLPSCVFITDIDPPELVILLTHRVIWCRVLYVAGRGTAPTPCCWVWTRTGTCCGRCAPSRRQTSSRCGPAEPLPLGLSLTAVPCTHHPPSLYHPLPLDYSLPSSPPAQALLVLPFHYVSRLVPLLLALARAGTPRLNPSPLSSPYPILIRPLLPPRPGPRSSRRGAVRAVRRLPPALPHQPHHAHRSADRRGDTNGPSIESTLN